MGAIAATASHAEAFLKSCNVVGPAAVQVVVSAEQQRARAEEQLRAALAELSALKPSDFAGGR